VIKVSHAAHTVELLREIASEHPTADAFVDAEGRRLSYGAWDRAADGIAGGLADHGVTVGDVVCLLMPSSFEYMVCYQAVMRLGAITSGINVRLGRDEIEHILRATAPRVTVVADDERDLPSTAGEVLRWSHLAHAWDTDAPALPALRARQPVVICWTGGTTGRPKGALFDHESLIAVAGATGALSSAFDRRLSPIPFAHVGTMTRLWDEISRVITTVITPPRWTAASALRLMQEERVTVAQGVATQWELMLRDPTFASTDLSSLRLAGIGGSRVQPRLLQRMRELLGVPVINRYASTEAGGVIAGTRIDDPDEVVVETVGRASEGVELRVVGDHGDVLDVGGVGRVQVRSAAVMREYWRDADSSRAAVDPDGWLTVGDVGRLDAAGNLTLVGRIGECYLRGGYNVYPAEVERVIAEHERVAEVAVVGAPDPVLGEIGVAYVVLVDPVDAQELVQWVRGRLADYKIPDRVVVLDSLPVTRIGKVDRRALAVLAAPPPPERGARAERRTVGSERWRR
jgi:acyl-CoA synthetase (AMP-forming)/AMP-acid ligase II